MKTDVNCNLNIHAEPTEIAEQIADGFIQPILNRRTEIAGQESSDQLYVDLMYKILLGRVAVIGVGAVGEFKGIAQTLLEDILRVSEQQNASETQLSEHDFLNQAGRPS